MSKRGSPGAARAAAKSAASPSRGGGAAAGSAPRRAAPSGSRAVAAQVARLVADVGVKTAANILGKSQSAVRTVDRAYKGGRIADAWTTKRGLSNWGGATARARSYVSPEVRGVMSGKEKPAGYSPAPRRADRTTQDKFAALHSQYRDGQIAKAMGVSRQQATAWRLKAARGVVPEGLNVKLAAAKDKLDRKGPELLGGLKIYNDPSKVPDSAISRNKYLTLAECRNWIANVEGGGEKNDNNPKNYFRIVPRGERNEEGEELYDIVYMPEDAREEEAQAQQDIGDDALDFGDLYEGDDDE